MNDHVCKKSYAIFNQGASLNTGKRTVIDFMICISVKLKVKKIQLTPFHGPAYYSHDHYLAKLLKITVL